MTKVTLDVLRTRHRKSSKDIITHELSDTHAIFDQVCSPKLHSCGTADSSDKTCNLWRVSFRKMASAWPVRISISGLEVPRRFGRERGRWVQSVDLWVSVAVALRLMWNFLPFWSLVTHFWTIFDYPEPAKTHPQSAVKVWIKRNASLEGQ